MPEVIASPETLPASVIVGRSVWSSDNAPVTRPWTSYDTFAAEPATPCKVCRSIVPVELIVPPVKPAPAVIAVTEPPEVPNVRVVVPSKNFTDWLLESNHIEPAIGDDGVEAEDGRTAPEFAVRCMYFGLVPSMIETRSVTFVGVSGATVCGFPEPSSTRRMFSALKPPTCTESIADGTKLMLTAGSCSQPANVPSLKNT